jgi:hypothetical protein
MTVTRRSRCPIVGLCAAAEWTCAAGGVSAEMADIKIRPQATKHAFLVRLVLSAEQAPTLIPISDGSNLPVPLNVGIVGRAVDTQAQTVASDSVPFRINQMMK